MAVEQTDNTIWQFEPGFMDVHTHPRIFDGLTEDDFMPANDGSEGKAGLAAYTAVALRSGITAMLAMGNETLRLHDPSSPELTATTPYPLSNRDRALAAAQRISTEAYIPTGFQALLDPEEIIKDGTDTLDEELVYKRLRELRDLSVGTKVFLAPSFGGFNIPVKFGADIARISHNVSPGKPVTYHVEGENVSQVLADIAALPNGQDIAVHIAHVSSRQELEAVIEAKDRGMNVSCEVTPHHLALTASFDRQVKPELKRTGDIKFLWKHLDQIDMIGSDCAPHRPSDKLSGTPGLANHSFMVPLLVQAVTEGKMTWEQLDRMLVVNPRRRFDVSTTDGSMVLVHSDGVLRTAEEYDNWAEVEYAQNPLLGLSPAQQKAVRLSGRILGVITATSKFHFARGTELRPSYSNWLSPQNALK